MKKLDGWLKKYSYEVKVKRSSEKYAKERIFYEKMSEDQLNENHISNKSKYECRKTNLALCGITIFLSVQFITSESFFKVIMEILAVLIKNKYCFTVLAITLIIYLLIMTITISLLVSYVKSTYSIYYKLLLIEKILETRK